MKILNFGSLNIDFVYGVEHFVLPGETIQSDGLEVFCGGKGLNQSIALAKAGGQVFHAGCVGEADGKILIDALECAGVDAKGVAQVATRSGNAIIQLTRDGQNCIILFGGANWELSKEHADKVLANFSAGDIILLQNEVNLNTYIMEQAKKAGLFVVLNPSPCNDKLMELPLDVVDCFILNEVEGEQLAGGKDGEQILERLKERYPAAKIVLTLGKEGALYFDGKKDYFQPIFPVKTVDTTAAGDTFTGYFLSGFARGLEPQKLLQMAAKASSLCVSVKGAANSIPRVEDVVKALEA